MRNRPKSTPSHQECSNCSSMPCPVKGMSTPFSGEELLKTNFVRSGLLQPHLFLFFLHYKSRIKRKRSTLRLVDWSLCRFHVTRVSRSITYLYVPQSLTPPIYISPNISANFTYGNPKTKFQEYSEFRGTGDVVGRSRDNRGDVRSWPMNEWQDNRPRHQMPQAPFFHSSQIIVQSTRSQDYAQASLTLPPKKKTQDQGITPTWGE